MTKQAIQTLPAKPTTKIATAAAMFRKDGGATLADLVAATGWQPHTRRAALTGPRKAEFHVGNRVDVVIDKMEEIRRRTSLSLPKV